MSHILHLHESVYRALWAHLLPPKCPIEQLAFVYANHETDDSSHVFTCTEWFLVPPDGFRSRTDFHIELTNECRAEVIKRAHDLGASLIEFHSHLGPWPAQFSMSDFIGFKEFVPHVWWRLKASPYLAVVITQSGFDGLVWVEGPDVPQRLSSIVVGDCTLTPTGLSPLEEAFYER